MILTFWFFSRSMNNCIMLGSEKRKKYTSSNVYENFDFCSGPQCFRIQKSVAKFTMAKLMQVKWWNFVYLDIFGREIEWRYFQSHTMNSIASFFITGWPVILIYFHKNGDRNLWIGKTHYFGRINRLVIFSNL